MAQKKKSAPKKAAPKKAAASKKAAAPKKVAAPKKASSGPIKDKMTKSQIVASLADSSGLSKSQVGSVMDGLEQLIQRSISKKGLGEFTIPGLMKIKTRKKPAVKAHMAVNPFTGQESMRPAKPASVSVRVGALKKLKEFAND